MPSADTLTIKVALDGAQHARTEVGKVEHALAGVGKAAAHSGSEATKGLDRAEGAAKRTAGQLRRLEESAGAGTRGITRLFNRLPASAATAGARAGRSFGEHARTSSRALLGGMFAGLGTFGLATVIKDSIGAAKQEGLGLRLVKAQFGDASEAAIRFGEDAAAAYGISAAEALRSQATFGRYLSSFGIAGSAAQGMSAKLVGLSADVAKASGADIGSVQSALAAGLRGRGAVLKQYGISLSTASIAQAALNHHIGDGKTKLTDQQKAMASYYAILDSSTKMQGTFARTSDTMGTKQQKLAAQVENLKGKLGQALLPALSTLFTWISNKIVPALQNMGEWWQRNADWLKPLIKYGVIAAAMFKGLTLAMALFNAVAAVNPVVLITAAVAALVTGLIYAYNHSEKFRNIVNSAFKAVGVVVSYVWENVLKPAWQSLQDIWSTIKNVWSGLGDFFTKVGSAIGDALAPVLTTLSKIKDAIDYITHTPVGGQASVDPGAAAYMQSHGGSINGYVPGKADGGMLRGPGTGTSDSMIIRASNGEFVGTAAATAKPANRKAFEFANAGGTIPGFADGGLVNVNAATTVRPALQHVIDKQVNGASWMRATGLQIDPKGNLAGAIAYAAQQSMLVASATQAAMSAVAGAVSSTGIGGIMGVAGKNNTGGAGRWDSLILDTLKIMGQPASDLGLVQRRIMIESSGDPRAINLTDRNAQNGTPSKGLVQVIDPTFAQYAVAPWNKDIWDPKSNLLAGENWAIKHYGSLAAGFGRAGGYDSGGWLPPGGGIGVNMLRRPEAVLTPVQSDAYVSHAKAVERGFGGGGVHVHDGAVRIEIHTAPGGDVAQETVDALRPVVARMFEQEAARSFRR